MGSAAQQLVLYWRPAMWRVWGVNRTLSTRPGVWLHKGSEQWLLPQHQIPRKPIAGILEKLGLSPLFPNQSSVAIPVKDWHVALNCWPKLLHQCPAEGLQWCRKTCTSPLNSLQLCWSTSLMGHGGKSPNCGTRLPFCVCHYCYKTLFLLPHSGTSWGKWLKNISEFRCSWPPQRPAIALLGMFTFKSSLLTR